jgi:alpha-ribazole phosphatase
MLVWLWQEIQEMPLSQLTSLNMKVNPTIIYIVRHAQSVHNAEYDSKKNKVTKTNELGAVLTDLGISQAQKCAQAFKDIHFNKIFSSDFYRAKQTADIIASEHNLVVTMDKLLRERSWGSFDGRLHKLKWEKLRDLQKDLSDKEKMKIKLGEDMESEKQALERFMIFLKGIAISYQGKTILIVCHGNIMRSLLVNLGIAKYDELPGGSIGNTGYYVLENNGKEFVVKESHGVNKVSIDQI